ncbi:MAG: PKD domain-containing protein [Candidatus Dormibacteraeota bacterium]|nr:PKD domain-containing protein [Candidatus Dormibacteraeota bacterium]
MKTAVPSGLSLLLLATGTTDGQGRNGASATVSITSVSGYAGHAFVYAQVSDSTFAYPAPNGTGHQSPFFSEWVPQPVATPSCQWIWAVYVFDRATNVQINAPPSTAPQPNFGTTTTICASPTTTPVDQPPLPDANARLDLDLQVSVAPAVSPAGSESLVSAVLSSALTQDLNLYLSMAIEDWSVTTWALDFGDGQSRTLNGPVGTTIKVSHTYQSPGRYDARAVAFISGHAQAAVYDRYGTVHLLRRPFSVAVGNHAMATAGSRPLRRYLAPQAVVGVVPYLGAAIRADPETAFRHIEVLRGALTSLSVHLLINREGLLVVDGVPRGFGRSRLTGWRYDGGPSDAPAGSGTVPHGIHRAADLMQLQWNSPDRIVSGQRRDYAVPVTLYVETRFPDGHLASYVIGSTFSVSVDFAAQSG